VLFTLGAAVWAIGTTVELSEAPVADGGEGTSGVTGFGSLGEEGASDGPVGFAALGDGAAGDPEAGADGPAGADTGTVGQGPDESAGPDAEARAGADEGAGPDTDADADAAVDRAAAGPVRDAPRLDEIDLGPAPDGHVRSGEVDGGYILYLPEGWELSASDEERFVYRGPEGSPFAGDVLMIERGRGSATGIDDLDALRTHHERTLLPFDEVEILADDDEQERSFVVGPRAVYSATTYRALDGIGEFLARTEIITASDTDVISVTYSAPADRFNDNFAAKRAAFDSFEVVW